VPLIALILLFIVVPFAELYVIIWVVGPALGAPLTILLLVLDSILGSVLMRSQGRAVWRRFNTTLAEGRIPHREVLDGVLVIFGGALLITPGFITDVLGFILLVPPTRALVRRILVRRLGRRLVIMDGRPPRARQDYDVEGTAKEYDAPSPRLEA
jgi:UPF0716 protein FxsA